MLYSDKQLQIISTAETLFSEKGFNGTSVRDIAEVACVNVAMISYYFGSKEKLMEAIFEQRTKHMTDKIEGLLKDDQLTSFGKIDIVIEDYVDRVVEKHKFFKLMITEQMLDKNGVISDLLKELKKRNSELIGKLIEDGQKKKAFKKDIDVILLINTMVGTVLHTFIGREYYQYYHNLGHLSDDEFLQTLKNKLNKHVKDLFKAILSYEG